VGILLCLSVWADDESAGNGRQARTVDLDIDIGADAVDYKWVHFCQSNLQDGFCRNTHTHSSAIANQESLSILEVEMRKLEAVVKEVVDEMGYLQRREMRMRDTNGERLPISSSLRRLHCAQQGADQPLQRARTLE